MNTSARVIKGGAPLDLSPFPIPTLVGSATVRSAAESFAVPVIDRSDLLDSSPQRPHPTEQVHSDLVEIARDEAAKIIAQAEASKELIEAAAREKAQIDAMSAFEEEVTLRVSDVREQFLSTIEKLSSLSTDIAAHVETDLVDLAMQIAKKIVRREVTIDREIALTLVRISLGKLNQRTAARVHLNPEDLAFVQQHLDSLDFRGSLELIEDSSITPGGCLVHTETGDVDARVESQFDEIAFGLLT